MKLPDAICKKPRESTCSARSGVEDRHPSVDLLRRVPKRQHSRAARKNTRFEQPEEETEGGPTTERALSRGADQNDGHAKHYGGQPDARPETLQADVGGNAADRVCDEED